MPLEKCGVNIRTILCVQYKSEKIVVPDEVKSHFSDIIYSNGLSISRARNRMLQHCYGNYSLDSYVLILDDDCYVTTEAGAALIRWMHIGCKDGILMGTPPWGIPMPFHSRRTIGVGWLWQAFVWSTVFNLKTVRIHEFDESKGPGTKSPHQAGEDFLFMLSIIRSRKYSSVKFDSQFVMGHTARGIIHEKKMRYSRGHAYALLQAISIVDSLYMKLVLTMFVTAYIFRPYLRYVLRRDRLALELTRHRLRSLFREIRECIY
jgi:glycosyltransferase involved in cell wall biosynthesis